jgi:hypothetical protein
LRNISSMQMNSSFFQFCISMWEYDYALVNGRFFCFFFIIFLLLVFLLILFCQIVGLRLLFFRWARQSQETGWPSFTPRHWVHQEFGSAFFCTCNICLPQRLNTIYSHWNNIISKCVISGMYISHIQINMGDSKKLYTYDFVISTLNLVKTPLFIYWQDMEVGSAV